MWVSLGVCLCGSLQQNETTVNGGMRGVGGGRGIVDGWLFCKYRYKAS